MLRSRHQLRSALNLPYLRLLNQSQHKAPFLAPKQDVTTRASITTTSTFTTTASITKRESELKQLTMALAPKFKSHRLVFPADPSAPAASAANQEPLNTLEMYLDYVCPYSAKMFKTFHESVAPAIRSSPNLGPRLQIIFRQQIQPWHPSSTLTHEAALAVARLAPSRFWDFSAALFRDQKAYFDISVVNEARNDTYRRLARLAAEATGGEADEKKVLKLLLVPEKPGPDGALNEGNGVTADVKVLVKMARLVGVHVSPTVIFNGVVADDVGSSFSLEQWMDWLQKHVA